MATESSNTTPTTIDTQNRPSKIPCEICGFLFVVFDIMEEHKELEHVCRT
ncbi:MAG: hypothetical protein ACXWFZ_08950 [Nitrososphaeraceae archaeon]